MPSFLRTFARNKTAMAKDFFLLSNGDNVVSKDGDLRRMGVA